MDQAGDVALWRVVWHGTEYWCRPEELRPVRVQEPRTVQGCLGYRKTAPAGPLPFAPVAASC